MVDIDKHFSHYPLIKRRRHDMVTKLFQIFVVISIMIILYSFYRYYKSQKRQFNKAKRLNKYYLLDNYENTHTNMHVSYQGCHFEGEKHLGVANNAYKVIKINMSVRDKIELRGLSQKDLLLIEGKIHERYPHAGIQWLHPINYLITDE